MRWDRLDDDTQREVLRLARRGQVHPDDDVACAAWELAASVLSARARLGSFFVGLLTLVFIAFDMATGGTAVGGSDGRSLRTRWRDRRAVCSIYRAYRRTDVPARCRQRSAAAKISVETLVARERRHRNDG